MRPAPLELQLVNPRCPVCDGRLSRDPQACWFCERCQASWPLAGGAGEWESPAAPQCEWLFDTLNEGVVRCALHAGHPDQSHYSVDGLGYRWSQSNNHSYLPPTDDDPGDGKRVNRFLVLAPFALALPFARDIAHALGWVA